MPLEVQGHTVSHLKDQIRGDLEPRGLRCGIIFILCHPLLKKAFLPNAVVGLVKFHSNRTVIHYLKFLTIVRCVRFGWGSFSKYKWELIFLVDPAMNCKTQ